MIHRGGRMMPFSEERGLQNEQHARQQEELKKRKQKVTTKIMNFDVAPQAWSFGDPLPSLPVLLKTVMAEFDLKLPPKPVRPSSAPQLRHSDEKASASKLAAQKLFDDNDEDVEDEDEEGEQGESEDMEEDPEEEVEEVSVQEEPSVELQSKAPSQASSRTASKDSAHSRSVSSKTSSKTSSRPSLKAYPNFALNVVTPTQETISMKFPPQSGRGSLTLPPGAIHSRSASKQSNKSTNSDRSVSRSPKVSSSRNASKTSAKSGRSKNSSKERPPTESSAEELPPTPAILAPPQSRIARSFRSSVAIATKSLQPFSELAEKRQSSLNSLEKLVKEAIVKKRQEEQESEQEKRTRSYSEDDYELIPWEEDILRDVFNNWDRAKENEVRVDDLPLLLADLGIRCAEEYMQPSLSGLLYATLDWDDFLQFLSEYRKLERKEFKEVFKDADEDSSGYIDMDELVVLLRNLGYPATRQAAEELIQAVDDNNDGEIEFFEFEQLVHHLRSTEGFNEKDLLQLRTFFDSEKTIPESKSDSPLELISLDKVWRIINFKGFPCSQDELRDLSQTLFMEVKAVTFRQMLKLIRNFRVKERSQTADLIEKFSVGENHAVQMKDLALALGDLSYYPEEESILEHLASIGNRECEDSLTPDELVEFLQIYRRHEGFTSGQIEEITEAFKREDVNGTGSIQALEMTRMLRTAGIRTSLQLTQHQMLKVDLEGSGLLDVQEVLKLIRLFHTQEAQLRRQIFLRVGDGDSRSLRMKYLPAALELIRGCKVEPTRLEVILGSLELSQEETIGFQSFERICSQFRRFDKSLMKSQAGFSQEEVLDLREAFGKYDTEGLGIIPDSRLSQVIMDAFPRYATSERQCKQARDFVKEVQQRWKGKMNFEAFLHLVRCAESEAEEEDIQCEAELVQEYNMSKAELQGFREVFVSKAKTESSMRWEQIVELFEFAMDDFEDHEIEKFMELLVEVDSHYSGAALRFPDFIRLNKRLTDEYYEKDLGFLRAALRKQRDQDDARAMAQCHQSIQQTLKPAAPVPPASMDETPKRRSSHSTFSDEAVKISTFMKVPDLQVAFPASSEMMDSRPRLLTSVTECSEEEAASSSLQVTAVQPQLLTPRSSVTAFPQRLTPRHTPRRSA